MNSKKTIQKILIALLIAVALLVGYSFLNQNNQDQGGQITSLSSIFKGTDGIDNTNVQLANTEILKILGSIQNIDLDDDIFSNPVFRDLRDTRFTIPKPLQIGRPNPFLPIGFDDVTIQTIQPEPEPESELEIEEEDPFFPSGQEV